MKRGKKSFAQLKMEKPFAFRSPEPYPSLIAEKAKAAKLKPNAFVRVAAHFFADMGLFDIHGKLSKIENELIRLRKDFNDALE